MKKAIYLTEDQLHEAIAHVVAHIGDGIDKATSPMLLMGFMAFGVKMCCYLTDNYAVQTPDNDTDVIDFPNSSN